MSNRHLRQICQILDRPMYYDRSGKPIDDLETFARLFADYEYKRVALYEDERVKISTVWLGIDHSFTLEGPPIIFETMVFVKEGADVSPEFDQTCWRWRYEEEAKEGHETIVRCYHEGIDPEGPVRAVKEKFSETGVKTLQ